MIIPKKDKYLIEIYKCPICNKIYRRQIGPMLMSCGVMHAPGTCCHYGEKELSEDMVASMLAIIEGTLHENVE